MKSFRETGIKDWCIEITSKNKKDVRNHLSPDLNGYAFNIGSYYGVMPGGTPEGNRYFEKVSNNVITDEEFYAMVSTVDYEIF